MLNVQNSQSDYILESVGDLIGATNVHNEHTILIVDDEINNLQLLYEFISHFLFIKSL